MEAGPKGLMPFERVETDASKCVCPPAPPCREPPLYHKMIPREHSTVIQLDDDDDIEGEEIVIDRIKTKRKARKLPKSILSRRKPGMNKLKKKTPKKKIKKRKDNIDKQIKSIRKALVKLERKKKSKKKTPKKPKKLKKPKKRSKSKSFIDESLDKLNIL